MGIRGMVKKVNGKARSVRLGIKLKDFENTTEEYEGGTSAEISFADVDTVMTSPIKNGKDEGLMTEIAELRAKNAELEEALKATVFCHTHIREEENDSTCYSLIHWYPYRFMRSK